MYSETLRMIRFGEDKEGKRQDKNTYLYHNRM
jgi:hypothetical protein